MTKPTTAAKCTEETAGVLSFDANHVVVCTGYHYVDDELFIVIMDNAACEGPIRYVLYEAFEEFHVLTVDASS